MFFYSNAAGIAGSIIVSVRLSLGLLYACSGPCCRQPSRRERIGTEVNHITWPEAAG